jgi:hypothetical protein
VTLRWMDSRNYRATPDVLRGAIYQFPPPIARTDKVGSSLGVSRRSAEQRDEGFAVSTHFGIVVVAITPEV